MTAWLCAMGAAAGGLAQPALLARAARLGIGPLGGVLRVLVVGALLLAAAGAGHLLAGVAGWAAGFGVGTSVLLRRAR
jgi:hypothetical protein